MYSIPQYVTFVLANAHQVRRWDLLHANFIANDTRMDNARPVPEDVLDNAFDENQCINFPAFSEKDIDILGELLDIKGPCGWGVESDHGKRTLSAVRRTAAVQFLIQHPHLIDQDEFVANPVAIEFIEQHPEVIHDKRAITRNPAALPFLMSNPQYIDWDIFTGVWYIGDSGSRRSAKKRGANRDDEDRAAKKRC